jgi:hypothetical protein
MGNNFESTNLENFHGMGNNVKYYKVQTLNVLVRNQNHFWTKFLSKNFALLNQPKFLQTPTSLINKLVNST